MRLHEHRMQIVVSFRSAHIPLYFGTKLSGDLTTSKRRLQKPLLVLSITSVPGSPHFAVSVIKPVRSNALTCYMSCQEASTSAALSVPGCRWWAPAWQPWACAAAPCPCEDLSCSRSARAAHPGRSDSLQDTTVGRKTKLLHLAFILLFASWNQNSIAKQHLM